jgi:hypothetical protein
MPLKKKTSDTTTKKTATRAPRKRKTTVTAHHGNPPADSQPADPARTVGEEQIRERAYQLYLARGAASGDAISDWVQADRELRNT